jgi:hypothetical protein
MSKDTIHLFNNLSIKGLVANGYIGSVGQALLTDGIKAYWGSGVGFTGSQGAGFTGSQGTTGFVGSQGDIGFTGSQGAGFTGSQGVIGFTGSKGDIGFTGSRGPTTIPQSGTDKTSSYTLQTSDVGSYIGVGSGGSITIPNAIFSNGDAVTIYNNTTGSITITCTISTAYVSGVNTDRASVTLATRAMCTIFFVSGTVCIITGAVT